MWTIERTQVFKFCHLNVTLQLTRVSELTSSVFTEVIDKDALGVDKGWLY